MACTCRAAFSSNRLVHYLHGYKTINGGVGMGNDKLLRTDFIRLKNMLMIFKRRYTKTNDEAASIQEVIKAIDRRLGD